MADVALHGCNHRFALSASAAGFPTCKPSVAIPPDRPSIPAKFFQRRDSGWESAGGEQSQAVDQRRHHQRTEARSAPITVESMTECPCSQS
jgi:hypothetical protein